MANIKKDKTNRAKTEEHAMQIIRPSINDIYDNLKINEKIENGKRIYNMPDNFFVTYRVDNGSNNINKLFATSILKWREAFLKNKQYLDQIVKNISKEELKSEPKKLDGKYPDEWEYRKVKKRKIKDSDKRGYAFGSIERYFKNINVDICKPKHIDQRLWRMIAAAKFFGIPKDRILKCKKDLLSAYFPAIDESLRIQINEHTTIEDIKYIWPKIFRKQIACRWSTGEKNLNIYSSKKGKSNYTNYERNKTAYEIKKENSEFTREEIKTELRKKGFETDFDTPYITVIIRKHGKQINKTK